ncbi:TetR/AcrR family transcriptional regulator [Nocardia sp. NPDC127579]|uniref:TetR/AcrR family transcriptional regulator n=1 Tax=Nocardia sp. NPDC127579 TaxID=3345402 RepID=UPI00362D7E0F
MAAKEPGRRERRKMETRNRLLDTALTLFATQGFEATTIDRIAEQADVARQTVLNYFPRKEEFVRAWVDRRQERLSNLLREETFRDLPARERLTGLVRRMAGYDEQESRVARAISDGWLRRDSGFFAAAIAPSALAEAVRLGQRHGDFDPAIDADLAAEVVYDCYLQTLNRWLHADTEFALDRVLLAKLDLVLNGLR